MLLFLALAALLFARPAPPLGEVARPREIKKVGENVYYFPWVGIEYGGKLDEFIKENRKKLTITGSGPEITWHFDSMTGEKVFGDVGHWVYVRPINQ
jgi:hypothetical protein